MSPKGWQRSDGLLCGFGDRRTAAPPAARFARQVHGRRLVAADAIDQSRAANIEADGLIARRPGEVVGVVTADCVPLLLVDPETRWAAAVHAGWRGTLAGIAEAAIAEARRAGCRPVAMAAALGPSIGGCCYQVDSALAVRFVERGYPAGKREGMYFLDLRDINRRILIRAGLSPEAIQYCGPCTRCRQDRYWSYRADPTESGRQSSWVGWRGR